MRLAVLGDPVAHSLSPLLHNVGLRELGLAGTYRARRVDREGMGKAVTELSDGRLDGANVTMPHKALAVSLADIRTTEVERAGAANTLVRVGDAVAAHNTDIIGVRHAWRWSSLPEEGPVHILGSGGAASAALLAVEGRPIFVSTRRGSAGDLLLERLGMDGRSIPWGEAVDGAVVVNATPIGMDGESLPPDVLDGATGLLDMAYGTRPTPAVVEATRREMVVADGSAMLLGQAIESFRLWTGKVAPLAAMRAALAASRRSTG